MIRNPLGYERAVREQRNDEPLLLRVRVDVQEIATREDFAPGIEEPEAAGVGHLIEETAMLVVIELAVARLAVIHREIVVAVETGQGTAPRDFDGAVQRNATSGQPA